MSDDESVMIHFSISTFVHFCGLQQGCSKTFKRTNVPQLPRVLGRRRPSQRWDVQRFATWVGVAAGQARAALLPCRGGTWEGRGAIQLAAAAALGRIAKHAKLSPT